MIYHLYSIDLQSSTYQSESLHFSCHYLIVKCTFYLDCLRPLILIIFMPSWRQLTQFHVEKPRACVCMLNWQCSQRDDVLDLTIFVSCLFPICISFMTNNCLLLYFIHLWFTSGEDGSPGHCAQYFVLANRLYRPVNIEIFACSVCVLVASVVTGDASFTQFVSYTKNVDVSCQHLISCDFQLSFNRRIFLEITHD